MKVKTVLSSIFHLIPLTGTIREWLDLIDDHSENVSTKSILNFGVAISQIAPISLNSFTY